MVTTRDEGVSRLDAYEDPESGNEAENQVADRAQNETDPSEIGPPGGLSHVGLALEVVGPATLGLDHGLQGSDLRSPLTESNRRPSPYHEYTERSCHHGKYSLSWADASTWRLKQAGASSARRQFAPQIAPQSDLFTQSHHTLQHPRLNLYSLIIPRGRSAQLHHKPADSSQGRPFVRPPDYSPRMLPSQLLWDPLPDQLPPVGRRWLPRFRAAARMVADSRAPAQQLVESRVRRGRSQALVRAAYLATVAEQDEAHRRPVEFADAWRAHLQSLLDPGGCELSGWGSFTIADLDIDLVWALLKAASRARNDALEHATITRSRPAQVGNQQARTFDLAITSEGHTLGEVRYSVCEPCRAGLLHKISIDMDWHFCGLGRRALRQLEARHPDVAWYTTGQYKHARGFYDRYRQDSNSPWSVAQRPCPHLG